MFTGIDIEFISLLQ